MSRVRIPPGDPIPFVDRLLCFARPLHPLYRRLHLVRWAPSKAKGTALEEFYYFIEGEGLMWADGEDIPVTAGDAVLAPEGSDHGFRNTGSEPLKLLIIWGKPMG